jgi:hypothetical protein
MSATGKRPNFAPVEPTSIESLMPEKMPVLERKKMPVLERKKVPVLERKKVPVLEGKMIEGAEPYKSVYVIMAINKKQKPNREAKRCV